MRPWIRSHVLKKFIYLICLLDKGLFIVRQPLFVYSEKNESEIKGIEVEIIMVEGENTTKLKYNSLKTNKVSALLFLK